MTHPTLLDDRLTALRELCAVQLRRVEDVLTVRLTHLEDQLRRVEARLKALEERRP